MFSSKNNTYEFDFEWMLTKKAIQSAINKNDGVIKSKVFHAGKYENVRFFFTLYPNGTEEDQAGAAWIYFNILNENDEVNADLSFDIDEIEDNRKMVKCNFTGSGSQGMELIKHEELPVVLDFYTLKCHGNLTIEPFDKWYLEKKKMNARDKDFRIIVDKKFIKVHKYVLQNISSIFDVMNEKQIVKADRLKITDFSYDIVKTGIDFYYGNDVTGTLNFEELISALHFADKFDMKELKAHIERVLMTKCSFDNVSHLLNVATECNAEKLKNICESKYSMLQFINGIDKTNQSNRKEIEFKLNMYKHNYIKAPKFKMPQYYLSANPFFYVFVLQIFAVVLVLIMLILFCPKS